MFQVNPGDVVRFVVGEKGESGPREAGGGGSTGVFINNTLVIVAGGGGGYDNTGGADQGGRASNAGGVGPAGACAAPIAATGGAGGAGAGCDNTEGGAGGGGVFSAGGDSLFPAGGGGGGAADLTPGDGLSVAAGGTAGNASNLGVAGGRGFTGGGGADGREAGGGGGYSGGAGANGGGGPGGGGSFVDASAAAPVLTDGANNSDSGDGLVRIEYSTIELRKTVTNDDTGTAVPADFTLRLTSSDGVYDGSTAFTTGDVVPITSNASSVTYSLSEDALAPYAEVSNSCSSLVHSLADIGTDYICTIANDDMIGMIDAIDDAPATVSSGAGGTIPNVVANDTLNGVSNPVIGTDVTVNETGLAQDGLTNLGLDVMPATGSITLDPSSGVVTVAPGTSNGTYVYTYEICEVGNATNCDTATVTVVVDDAPAATNDTVTATDPGPVTINPLTNDTGSDPLDPTSVVLTGTGAPGGSTLAPDGKTLTVPGEGVWSVDPVSGAVTFTPEPSFSGTPTPAAYTVSDTMGRTSNEALLSVTVLATPSITATNDGPIAVNGVDGATSPTSVLSNDTLNGSPITNPALVNLTPLSLPSPAAGSISLNPDGTITVAPGTTAGTYTISYEICDAADPANCATAQADVIVLGADTLIPAIEEDLTAILEEDLANTLTMQSRQIGGYAADASDRLRGRTYDQCLADVNARLATTNILFDTDKAVIKSASNRLLDEIATILASCPGSAFEIAGHTDSDASDAYNLDLSERRVVAVLNALTARGIDTAGYVARGYGERQPIASNATAAGKAQNRRVEFRSLGGSDIYQGPCDNQHRLVRAFDLTANDDGVDADGEFLRDRHDCITDSREVFEGSLSYTDTDGQTQSAINLSYRREHYRGGQSVFGYFAGLYASNSDVSSQANGDIRGLGVNAGVYGAKRLQQDMILDYYLGAAVGRHKFDLDFDSDGSTIATSGDYNYWAGFAGAALSGELEYGETTVTPRIGFDYVYTPGADVDVIAELGGLSEVGALELDSISGGRIFAELRTDRLVRDGTANLWFNPRIACYSSLGSLDDVCGVGGSLGIESVDQDSDLSYAFEIDGEWGSDYFLGTLSLKASRQFGLGYVSGDAGLNSDGNVTMGANFEMNF